MKTEKIFMAEIREKKGLRQFDLARLVGVSEGVISRIETGRLIPDPSLVEKIESNLGFPMEQLLRQVDVNQSPLFSEVEKEN